MLCALTVAHLNTCFITLVFIEPDKGVSMKKSHLCGTLVCDGEMLVLMFSCVVFLGAFQEEEMGLY